MRIKSLILLAVFAVPMAAPAQDDITASRRTAIVQAIEKAAPAVVSINVLQIRRERVLNPWAEDFWDLFSRPPIQERLRGHTVNAIGSGFFIDNRGHILTNYHVVERADAISSVTLSDGRSLDVERVLVDERSDLAVLKVNGADLPSVELGDSDDLLTGEWVIAIGNPFGTLIRDPQPTVSVGVVSALRRYLSRDIASGQRLYQRMIQTDAAINPGNSGGPLVDSRGRVVGVNTMIFSQSGGSVGLGFAIPINRAKRVADELIVHARRRDPWAGFRVQPVSALRGDVLRQLGIKAEQGCLVVELLTNCPASAAGLKVGDVITKINDVTVVHPSDIDFEMWSLFVGDTITLEVDRQGRPISMQFEVQELASPTR
jgi:serine protease Do